MTTKIATSLATGTPEDVSQSLRADLERGLAGEAPQLVLAFASPAHPLAGVLSGLGASFPGALVIGATTAGELTEKGDMSDALGGAPLAGFETYGEIALDTSSLSGFHNTTSVVLAFPEE